ncbi:MAG: hypothetical protein Q9195_003224, partial [Heterodermia aff. obscurata]
MAASNMRVTRSMAAAARDGLNSLEPGIELKQEEQAASTSPINHLMEVKLTELWVENEGARWLLANQGLLHSPKVVYERPDEMSDPCAEEEGNDIMPRLKWVDVDSGAHERRVESNDYAAPLIKNETMGTDWPFDTVHENNDGRGGSEISQSDASITSLEPYQDDTNATLVMYKEAGNWKMGFNAESKLRARVRSLEVEYTRLKDSREVALRSFAEKYEEAKSNELKLAALMEENADLTMSLGFQQKVEVDLTNTLESLWTTFPKLPVGESVKFSQVKETRDLKEQILALQGIITDLEAENKELKESTQQQDQRADIPGEVSSNTAAAALPETRVKELEEENTSLRVKLIDALEKLVTAQEQTTKRPPTGDKNGNNKHIGSGGDEPLPKKPKLRTNQQLPPLRFLQPSTASSNRFYRCLVPKKVDYREESGFLYVAPEHLLPWYVREITTSLLAQLDAIGTIHGRYAWQSASALEENCAFCRLISRRESE